MKSDQYRSEEERGMAYVELWKQNPKLLPQLLGNFYDTSPRGVFLRRLLLALNILPRWLRNLGHWIFGSVGKEKWTIFEQQYAFWWGVRRALGDRETWQRLTQGVPILMYHAFGTKPEPASRFVIPVQKFATQMWLLQFLKYHVISLDEYVNCLRRGALPPQQSIVITIDDGYLDNYLLAYQVLKRFRFPATIFLVSSQLGKANYWDKNSVLTGRTMFNLKEAKEMEGDVISFGAHTCTHPFLTKLSDEEMREEINQSKIDLEQGIGNRIQLFSYPYGNYDRNTMTVVEQLGFVGACTTDPGLNTFETSIFALHRTEIFGAFSIWRFLRAVYSGA